MHRSPALKVLKSLTDALANQYKLEDTAMLPMYHIGKIPLICCVSALFAHESRYVIALNRVFGNPCCYFTFGWLTPILSCSLWCTSLRLHQVVQNADCLTIIPINRSIVWC